MGRTASPNWEQSGKFTNLHADATVYRIMGSGGHDGVSRCSREQYAVATVKAAHSAERGHVWVTLCKAILLLHPLSSLPSLLGSYEANVRVRRAGGG